MKRHTREKMLVLVVVLWVSGLNGIWAQEAQPAQPAQPAEPTVTESAALQESVSEVPIPEAGGVFPILSHKGDIADFLKLLSKASHKNIIPSPQVRGPISVSLFDVTFKEALDAVLLVNGFAYEEKGPFIFVYTIKEMSELEAKSRQVETRLYKLNYIPAKDVSGLISPLLSNDGEVTTSPEAGQPKTETGEGWAVNNYVVVRDYPEQLEQVAKLIKELDRRPPQVLVEATIMVASLEDINELGIDLNVLGGVNFEAASGAVDSVPSDAVSLSGTETSVLTGFAGNVTSGGLSIGIVKNNIGLFIAALESITDVVTLGNPKVLTLNRQQGKVIVGNRDGYITTQVSQTTATQTVEFLETGTQLTFRPFVMSDGYIRMELNPKDSDGGVQVTGTFTLPSESTAEVTTNVLVKDGHTIVIGGLFREKTTLSRSQVPLVGNIPFIGDFFRSTNDTSTKEEVIFLITPHLVEEEADYAAAEEVLERTNQWVFGVREGVQWHSRERLAAAHYNWAMQHEAAGRLDKALWDAKLAAHISPCFMDAIQLKDRLQGEQLYQGEYGNMRTFIRGLIEKGK